MLGVEPWEKRGEQLARYLKPGTHEELQMGAVSGLADVDAPAGDGGAGGVDSDSQGRKP